MSRNQTERQVTAAGIAATCLLLATSAVFARADSQQVSIKKSHIAKTNPAKDRKSHMTDANFTQDVQSGGEAVTVLLNGWPIADIQGGQQAGLINYAVIDGANHLKTTISAPPGNGKPDLADAATVLIQNGNATIFSLKWKASATPTQSLPLHKETTFQSGTHFGPRVWQNAPPVVLDDAAKQAIRAQVHHFRDTLDAKNLDGMVQMFAARDREDALSHGEAPAQNTAAAREDYQQMLTDPHWHMAPIHDDKLQFHLIVDKRVVHVDYGRDTHVLTTVATPSGDVTAFDLYLSLVNGQWTIVQ